MDQLWERIIYTEKLLVNRNNKLPADETDFITVNSLNAQYENKHSFVHPSIHSFKVTVNNNCNYKS